ncbi:Glu-tRNA(Gln) amidotransferase subunit GatE, partial [Candidatus Woesearchaeota archaeon]|nr:Glu-tRNA(Gln) amidotransferase subunit GatE [Candidatus Woesearchaeota archaeon]
YFDNMDYKELGFKAGIEIHQQLSGKKLFCDCPADNVKYESDRKVERYLRAVVGETGEVDVAAAHETSKMKKFIYEANSKQTCNIEFDEEPPKNVNLGHLKTAILVSKMLNAKIVDEVQVMRKIVVDGSNVSGFQRTMLVGYDGYIETEKGKVVVTLILLEEEAAQKIEAGEDFVKYNLARLGIPLLEISTDASIKDAEHAKEVAAHIGMVLRSTEKVKRGIGTIRQDVNVSIKGGCRTEVKGFQDLKSIPKVIHNEIDRQLGMIEDAVELKEEVRKAEPDFSTTFLRPIPGAARLYPETDCLPITITKEMIDEIEIPELISEKIEKLMETYNISDVLANGLAKSGIKFCEYVKEFKNLEPKTIGQILIDMPKDIKSRLNIDTSSLNEDNFKEALTKLNKDEISKDSIVDVLALMATGKEVDYSKFEKADLGDVEERIKKIVDEKPGLNAGGYMGLVMAEFKGQVDGATAMKILNKILK